MISTSIQFMPNKTDIELFSALHAILKLKKNSDIIKYINNRSVIL